MFVSNPQHGPQSPSTVPGAEHPAPTHYSTPEMKMQLNDYWPARGSRRAGTVAAILSAAATLSPWRTGQPQFARVELADMTIEVQVSIQAPRMFPDDEAIYLICLRGCRSRSWPRTGSRCGGCCRRWRGCSTPVGMGRLPSVSVASSAPSDLDLLQARGLVDSAMADLNIDGFLCCDGRQADATVLVTAYGTMTDPMTMPTPTTPGTRPRAAEPT